MTELKLPPPPRPGNIYTDSLQITEDEATEHVAHHLRLAAMFFSSTPEDLTIVRGEILNIIEAKHGVKDPAFIAAVYWLDAIIQYYNSSPRDL